MSGHWKSVSHARDATQVAFLLMAPIMTEPRNKGITVSEMNVLFKRENCVTIEQNLNLGETILPHRLGLSQKCANTKQSPIETWLKQSNHKIQHQITPLLHTFTFSE